MADLSLARAASEVGFQVRAGSSRTVLRVASWEAGRVGDAQKVLAGCKLPGAVDTVIEELPRVLCTAPGEWLLIYPPTGVARLRNILAPELAAQSLVLVDLTDGLVVLEIAGSAGREVLGRCCGLDFDLRRFGAGKCARTRFAQISVVIDCIHEPSSFTLYAPRSYAAWLTDWLCDVGFGA